MADKNIQITQRNADNTGWDNVYPKTKASNVIADDGTDLEVQLAQIPKFQTAQGTATAIILTGILLTDGYSKTFVVANDNGSSVTTVNGKNLYKPNTTTPPNLTKGKAVTIWYDLVKTCFFIKASAEGNTIAAHVLAGDTFSNDNDTGLIGTMPNKGAVTQALAINGSYTIPAGYHNGLGVVNQSITTKAAATFNPSTAAQIIAANQYLNGVQTIAATTGSANVAQVLSGYTFNSGNGIGLTGNIPSKVAATITPTTVAQTIVAGQYLSGTQTIAGDGNLSAGNIRSGVSIFGVAGSATIQSLGGKAYASGTLYSDYNTSGGWFTSVTLPFTPTLVVATYGTNSYVFIILNTPSVIGLATPVEWNNLPSLNSGSYLSATITARAVTYGGQPGVKISGNTLTFGYSSSNHYYNWVAYGN